MKLEFHPEAEEEFLEAVSYYEVQMPGLGERFAAEVRAAGALLLEYPEIGQVMSQELRKLVLDRFPYYLIHNILPKLFTSSRWLTNGASPVTGRHDD